MYIYYISVYMFDFILNVQKIFNLVTFFTKLPSIFKLMTNNHIVLESELNLLA